MVSNRDSQATLSDGQPKPKQVLRSVYRDLAATWEGHGAEAMQKCALTEPSKFVAICR
jgi:hypothetical protein